jgi:exosortase
VLVEGRREWWAWGTGAVLLALLGLVAANDLPQRWGALAGALALMAALGSVRVRGAWRAPLLACFLLVPWPYVIYYATTSRLQRLSSQAAEVVLRFSGVPLSRDGNLLHFPGYRLEVVEACGGLRSLLAMTALAAVVAAATRCSVRRTLLLLGIAVPLALGSNLLRLVLTGWVSQLQGPDAAAGIYHTGEGLVTFVVGSLLLGGVALAGRREV